MLEFFEYGNGDTGFPRLNPHVEAALRALPGADHVRVFLAVDHEMSGVTHEYGPGQEMLAGRAKNVFGLVQAEALAEHQRALAGLKAEPGLPVSPTDALNVLATWARMLRVGVRVPRPEGLNKLWRAGACPGAVAFRVKQLETATDADADICDRSAQAIDLLTFLDDWMLAQWASETGADAELAAAEELVAQAIDAALFDHVLDIAIGEVATWRLDLATCQPTLYRASRVWAILAAREEIVRGTTDPAANILSAIGVSVSEGTRIYDRTTGDIFAWGTATKAQRDALRQAAGGYTDEIISVMAEERGDLWLNFNHRSCRVSPALFRAAGQGRRTDVAGGDNAFSSRA